MLKNVLKRLLDLSVVKVFRYVFPHDYFTKSYKPNAYRLLKEQSIVQAASFIEGELSNAMLFEYREALWEYAFSRLVSANGICLEFGVYRGVSINHCAKLVPDIQFYGFDSFEGLAEDWLGHDLAKGHFNMHGKLPVVPSNVKLISGWFDQTVPAFLPQINGERVLLVHIDCDTYESTALVLNLIKDKLVPGTILIFDEYQGHLNWRNGEFKAWQEMVAREQLEFKYIGFSTHQAAVQVV